MALRLMRTAFDRRRSDPLPYLCRRLTRMRAIDRQNDPQLDANLANALVDRHRITTDIVNRSRNGGALKLRLESRRTSTKSFVRVTHYHLVSG
ncbi:hypothetical protein PGTUg99_017455 [Puccinia graminis f. sp. tritici]|uniref:Uncharacterized protein n=1 Tax=Puccinia graminis f. sp. tritici TaxID=56615 RepID=A0A5B0R6L1_PUCGR|nr:hypothetical protein PGTUg99_017455 [Puccinia graminis f. sp. tritici]